MDTDMKPYVETLAPALRRLHDAADVHGALRLVEVIADLCEDTAGISSATALLGVAEQIDGGPISVPLACLGAARILFDHEEFGHGVGSCDVLAAELFAATGQTDRALELYDDGLELLITEIEPGFAGRAWHNHAILLRRAGRPAESLESQRRALAAYRDTGQATPTADCHVGIGLALCDLGQADDALEPYAAARALYLEFGDDALVADTDDRRGLALCDLGRYPEAAAAHAAAVARYEQLGEAWLAARSRRYRSHPLDHAGEHAEALAELEAARCCPAPGRCSPPTTSRARPTGVLFCWTIPRPWPTIIREPDPVTTQAHDLVRFGGVEHALVAVDGDVLSPPSRSGSHSS